MYDKPLAGEDCLNTPICYKRRVIIVGSRTATCVLHISGWQVSKCNSFK